MADDGWREYQRLVLAELARLDESIQAINARVQEIQVDLGQLKVKSGIWGAIAGFIAVTTALLMGLITKLF
mgnify:FL=1